jgi:hypothetical protein
MILSGDDARLLITVQPTPQAGFGVLLVVSILTIWLAAGAPVKAFAVPYNTTAWARLADMAKAVHAIRNVFIRVKMISSSSPSTPQPRTLRVSAPEGKTPLSGESGSTHFKGRDRHV